MLGSCAGRERWRLSEEKGRDLASDRSNCSKRHELSDLLKLSGSAGTLCCMQDQAASTGIGTPGLPALARTSLIERLDSKGDELWSSGPHLSLHSHSGISGTPSAGAAPHKAQESRSEGRD